MKWRSRAYLHSCKMSAMPKLFYFIGHRKKFLKIYFESKIPYILFSFYLLAFYMEFIWISKPKFFQVSEERGPQDLLMTCLPWRPAHDTGRCQLHTEQSLCLSRQGDRSTEKWPNAKWIMADAGRTSYLCTQARDRVVPTRDVCEGFLQEVRSGLSLERFW